MSDKPLEPLAPELEALIARESEAYSVDHALQASVLRHVETSVTLGLPSNIGASANADGTGLGAGTGAAAKTIATAAGTKKLVAVGLAALLVGGGVGAGVTASVYESRAPHASETAPPARAANPTQPPEEGEDAKRTTKPGVPIDSLPTPSSARTAPSAAPSANKPLRPRSDIKRERELLDVARAALARGRPGDAIEAAKAHERKWPNGSLREEREVLLIQALVRAGRRDEAERRAERFRKAFPNSMLRSAVDSALSAH